MNIQGLFSPLLPAAAQENQPQKVRQLFRDTNDLHSTTDAYAALQKKKPSRQVYAQKSLQAKIQRKVPIQQSFPGLGNVNRSPLKWFMPFVA